MSQATNDMSNGIIAKWKSALLHLAIEYKFQNLTDFLINHNSHLNNQDEFGKTPLMKATCKLQIQTVKTLLSKNADMLVSDLNGKNALQTAMELPSILECTPIVQMYADKIANICANNDEILKVLSSVKCPLSHVIYFKDAALTREMLTRGYKVNQRNPSDGNTALHVAVMLYDLENIKVLLESGADRSIVNNEGYMPFVSIFTSKISAEAEKKCTEILNLVMPLNVNWTDCDREGKMKLYPIFVNSSTKFLQIFLKIYNVDLNAKDAEGKTPLHYLVERDKTDAYEIFKSSQIDVNARDKSGRTPLHIAAMRGNGDAVKFLLDKGANTDLIYNGLRPIFLVFSREGKITPRRTIALLLENATKEQLTSEDTTIYLRIFNRFDDDYQTLAFSESVSAHLAMLEKLGRPSLLFDASVPFYVWPDEMLEPYFRRVWKNKIAMATKYYWIYKEQLDDMKAEIVYGSVTLFDILTDDSRGKLISRYAWKVEKVDDLLRKFYKERYTFYYKFRLATRFENAIKLARWRIELAEILCDCTGLFNCDHVVVETIVRLLEYDDLKMFD